jgi:hypothetical protein
VGPLRFDMRPHEETKKLAWMPRVGPIELSFCMKKHHFVKAQYCKRSYPLKLQMINQSLNLLVAP